MTFLRVISYIDGFNLYYGLRSARLRWAYWLDLQKLSAQFLMPGQILVETRYFTSIVTDPPDKHQRQAVFLEALQTLPAFSMIFGQFLVDTVVCPSCGYTYTTHHEKMTDVNIAVHMVTDAIQDRFDVALLFSADSDLASTIEKVHSLTPAKKIICVFPPERRSKHLTSVADGYKHIDYKILSRSLFPDTIRKPNGYILRRPSSWK
jgi:uncharacterized LabA/DUF88 family protein